MTLSITGYASGSKLILMYDTIPFQSLNLVAGTADISDTNGAIGTCTVDSITFYTECILSGVPVTTLILTLTNFPNQTVVTASTNNIFQTIGINAAAAF